MERGIEIMTVVALLILGISHIVRPRAWVAFFSMLREKGEAGVFALALLHLWPALLIIAFHNRWSGIPLIVTLLGWAWTLKAAVYFTFPHVGLMGLGRVSIERAREFVIAGVVLVAMAGLVASSLWNR
jgi:hypothetical protein